MNVIMDVVYNHTNAAGPTDRTSVLDKIVPWYYQRLNEITGSVESATCCSDFCAGASDVRQADRRLAGGVDHGL
ncbi:pullulanase [Klebsiella michiganensis]|uniref:Pullulanase n=1 Tax=Klebsiella michiganensis TaxID=1134687 RepID=A0A7H4N7B2_9ENTR|nr:pullulanase [Klebsiella michiganensis]